MQTKEAWEVGVDNMRSLADVAREGRFSFSLDLRIAGHLLGEGDFSLYLRAEYNPPRSPPQLHCAP